MIQLDLSGNFSVDANDRLVSTPTPALQNAQCECRCEQGTYVFDTLFGRNQFVWNLGQSISDRANDIARIVNKYCQCISVQYKKTTGPGRGQYLVEVV